MITTIDDFNLLPYNTFRMNVNCSRWIEYTEASDLPTVMTIVGQGKYKHIGAGSNLLFTGNFSGTILHSRILDLSTDTAPNGDILLRAGAGIEMDQLIEQCCRNGIWGLENLSGIPGEVGSAAVQNVGAYGVEAGDLIDSVEAYDCQQGQFVKLLKRDCQYAYRDSFFKHNLNRYIVTNVTFRLSNNQTPILDYGNLNRIFADRTDISPMDIRQTIIEIRNAKLPQVQLVGSAGSFFKNPIIDAESFENIVSLSREEHGSDYMPPHFKVDNGIKVPAAWLIDQSGMKGRQSGNASVWMNQPLVIVNSTGKATPEEIINLENQIITAVKNKFGITLFPEVEHIA